MHYAPDICTASTVMLSWLSDPVANIMKFLTEILNQPFLLFADNDRSKPNLPDAALVHKGGFHAAEENRDEDGR